MNHILDNPIWNALISNNAVFSTGNEQAKVFNREVAIFAGMKDNSESDLEHLAEILPNETPVILFTDKKINLARTWKNVFCEPLTQMIFSDEITTQSADNQIQKLNPDHIPSMIELIAKTNPGPFFSRTIELGNYEGIFEDGQLVAMTGQRLRPDKYTEISAVCTHPDYSGKGYAGKLIRNQLYHIRQASRIPFLHTLATNYGAIRLYERLGFSLRKIMVVYTIVKN
jgi:predicted GNAT family acetyltransferase